MLNRLRQLIGRLRSSSSSRDVPSTAPVGYDLSGGRFQVRLGGRWLDAPDDLIVAPGTRLVFRFELAREHDVAWVGAFERTITRHESSADIRLDVSGDHDVRVDVLDLDGHRVASLVTHVIVRSRAHAA